MPSIAKRVLNDLTTKQQGLRERLETVIERALRYQLEAAQALMQIRDDRLYRDTHDTFEQYCESRWGFSREQGRRLCQWAEVTANLTAMPPIGGTGTAIVPLRESHARPLAQLTPAQQRIAWDRLSRVKHNAKLIEAVCHEVSRTPINGKPVKNIINGTSPTDGIIRPINRYGAKSALAKRIIGLLPPHDCYVEPFFGSGAVLFAKAPSKVEIVNDLDAEVVNLFRVLRQPKRSQELQRLLKLTPYARDEHEWCRKNPQSNDPVEQARTFFVRCRQSYGGEVDGPWATTQNANRASEFMSPVDQLHLISERLRRVQVEHKDFRELLPACDRIGTVSYLDPPYIKEVRGRGNVYAHEMTDDDHEELLRIITRFRRGGVVLSGYPSSMYDRYLKKWKRYEIPVTLSAKTYINGTNKIGKRIEVLWSNL
jgi:DNA adenine methylase